MTLTAKDITAALPGAVIRDEEVRGLHLRAFPDRKSFYLYYRTRSGQERRPKIGDYPTLTINDARRVARSWLVEVASGNDPSASRRDDRAGMTIDELIDRYERTKLEKRRSARSIKIALRAIREHLGHRKVAELTLADAEDLHARLSRKAPIQANRTLAYLSVLLELAESLEVRPLNSNFCRLIERNRETKRRRYLRPGPEAQALGVALRKRMYGPQHEAALFVLLLLLTGARKGEIGSARLEDRQGATLVLGEHKTVEASGEKVIHLPEAAVSLLDDPLRPQHARVGYLVGIADPRKLWAAVRAEAGCADLRLHDLRHSFVSFGIGSGVSLSLAGLLVGHASPATTKRYEHLLDDPAKEAVNRIADAVGAALRPEQKEAAE